MTNVIPFTYESNEIRTISQDGQPWFIASDVAAVLGYRMASDMTRRLDEDEKGTRLVRTPGGEQEMLTISEAGLYTAILGSRVEGAKKFKRWVTHEVLPTIRKHGMYATEATVEVLLNNPDAMIGLLQQIKKERAARAELEAQAKTDAPKVLFADSVTASHTTILIGELAKILRGNGINIGQNRLFAWMRDNGYLIARKGTDRNMPTQHAMELGLFKIKETAITHSDGHVSISKTTKVTGKGQTFFINLFLGDTLDVEAAA